MPGAFDLALAGAVITGDPARTVDRLDALVARSLLHTVRDEGSGEIRYRLLETIRVYAHQRLIDGGDAEATRGRHAAHIADRLAIYSEAMTMAPEHHLLAEDALLAVDWAQDRDDLELGARLVSAACPIFIGRGLREKGRQVHEWAAGVDDPSMRSMVLARRGLLALAHEGAAAGAKYSRQALDAAGAQAFPGRTTCYLLLALAWIFIRPADAHALLRRAQDELSPSGATREHAAIDCWLADIAIWQRDYRTALDVSGRRLRHADLDPLVAMGLHGAHLLAALLCEDADVVERHLTDPDIEMSRRSWFDGARRGEHWLLGYEAIRGAAVAWTGDHDSARRDLAQAAAMIGPDAMSGVDVDCLGALAWTCLVSGEIERAREMLDDTYTVARSPNTHMLVTETRERANGVVDPTTESRIAELFRQHELSGTVEAERRTRRMLDSELDRLHLK